MLGSQAMMPTYNTFVIPPYSSLPPNSLAPLAQKLRSFKLHALLSDPNAFSQSHAAESQLPLSAWVKRVSNPGFRIVVCIVDSGDIEESGAEEDRKGDAEIKEMPEEVVKTLLASDWAGTFTLVGPVSLDAWVYPMSGQPETGSDEEEKRWHLTSLFVLPQHRGRGLAAKLTIAAVQAGSFISQNHLSPVEGNQGARRTTRFRLIVHPKNKPVVGLYEKLGFVVGGLYTQREAMMAMGDAAGIPEDAEKEKWDTRLAIGMEYLV